jgi:hypothetical protein
LTYQQCRSISAHGTYNGHASPSAECPLSGVKRACRDDGRRRIAGMEFFLERKIRFQIINPSAHELWDGMWDRLNLFCQKPDKIN